MEHSPYSPAWSWALQEIPSHRYCSEVLGVFSEVQKVVSVSCVLGKHAHSFQREAFGEVLLQGTVRPGGKFVSAFPAVL